MELSELCKKYNFNLKDIRPVEGSSASLVQMVYEKTQTELCWYKSTESNKLFSIAFKTVPENDTGVFHILEHSVLCGSKKYPVKEPFVELLKSSMNTFLNAMTFPDKTMYPVSSRNEQDFLNLTSVYLDAVFAPNILHNPNIFRQEGWHYEIGENGELSYNGVVFNEMKGATSSVEDVVYRGIQHLVFPDNGYSYNSGGEPSAIPDLTYEQYIETYKKNYHPTNARVYLDGDVPIEKVLSMLDEYLGSYELGEKQPLGTQTPVSSEKTLRYEAPNDGTPKAQYVLGRILGSFDDKTKILAAGVLCDALAGSNDAPLKKAVLETGLCQDLSFDIDDGLIQPLMMLQFKNIEDENAKTLENTVRACAEKLVSEGIPKERLIASINRFAFKIKNMREPQALIRCITMLNSWLYGGDPMLYLSYDGAFDTLREMTENGGFESVLKEMLVDENGLCRLHVVPDENFGTETREAENRRLQAEKAALSEEAFEELKKQNSEFSKWQQTPDSPEQLATLPMLGLSEISGEPNLCPTEEEEVGGVTLLRHKIPSNGIVHLTAYFRMTDRSLEEISRLNLLSRLLGELPTRTKDSETLQNEVKTYVGDLKFGIEVFSEHGDRENCVPMLVVRCSVLKDNLAKAEELIREILTETDFEQPELIRQVVLQAETEAQQMGMMGGHALAIACVRSHYTAVSAVQEALRGYSAIKTLHDLSKNFDSEISGLVSLFREALAFAVCRKRLVLSVTEDENSDLSSFVESLEEGSSAPEKAAYKTSLPKKLGIRIPAQVSFAAIGSHIGECCADYDGTAALLSNILSLGYLWNEVRVKGGAYGAGMRIAKNGEIFTYSFRDPNPSNSIKTNRSMGDFTKEFASSDEDITGYIISTVAETEPLLSPDAMGRNADANRFSGFGYDEAAAERKALLEATPAKLEKWCGVLDSLKENAAVCVVGYSEALESCSEENLTVVDI
ncbi:MAG: insulinase family protein [Oscillospiraceae bacterium]|nr:insulinase family protein [Oscillospiraceae bacterium]